jgi:hypothetical protein
MKDYFPKRVLWARINQNKTKWKTYVHALIVALN